MTLVFQSYRTHDVSPWIRACMHSVKNWTRKQGFEYAFVDDALFDYVPQWYREKVKGNVQLVSDLARLVLAKKYLKEGYERVIWMDADLVIFNPEGFEINTTGGFYFCREVWSNRTLYGRKVFMKKVNNSVSVFHQDQQILDFYEDACLRLVREAEEITPVLVGTKFLTDLREIYPFPLLKNVGILSPALTDAFLRNKRRFLEGYIENQGSSVAAVNLCGSHVGEAFGATELNAATLEEVVEKLIAQKELLKDSDFVIG